MNVPSIVFWINELALPSTRVVALALACEYCFRTVTEVAVRGKIADAEYLCQR